MAAASSQFFRINLGSLEDSTFQRLDEWCRTHFAAHSLSRGPAGEVLLYASSLSSKNKKSIGMTMRTLFNNWSAPLELRDGWLEMITQTDYETGAGASEAAGAKGKPPHPMVVHTPVLEAPSVPTKFEGNVMARLSEGFDMRAEDMLRRLQISCA